jgi:hypothetical protein
MVLSAWGPMTATLATLRPSGSSPSSFFSNVTDSSARRRDSSLPSLATVEIVTGSSVT